MADPFAEGLALRERRRLKAAVQAFERAVTADPEDPRAWFWLAATRDNRGLELEAIPAYERALRLGLDGADETKAWTWLASSYSKTGRHREAMEALARAAAAGGYEPLDEYTRVIAAVKRRSEQRG